MKTAFVALRALVLVALFIAGSVSSSLGQADVRVLHAGSLITLFQREIGPAFEKLGYHFEGEGRGSVANANMIKDGLRTPDVYLSADDQVMADLMRAAPDKVSWYIPLATTRIVVAYSPKSAFAKAFNAAALGQRAWIETLLQEGVKLGRTDPAIDPKGYRAIIVCKLAQQHYGAAGFARKLLGDDRNPEQTFPDETILLRLEEGSLDAAFVYSTEAVSRHLPVIELPSAINLGDPKFASVYATQSVTINGAARKGAPIEYAITVPRNAPNPQGGVAFVEFLLSPKGQAMMRGAGLGPVAHKIIGDATEAPRSLRGRLLTSP